MTDTSAGTMVKSNLISRNVWLFGVVAIISVAFNQYRYAWGNSETREETMDVQLSPDMSKINSYSFELEDAEALHGPFVTEFKRGSKRLIYVAAHHENSSTSKTFKLISRAFKLYPIGVVVIEGVQRKEGLSPQSILDSFIRERKGKFYKWGESSYAAIQAAKRMVPFVGAEPDECDVCKQLLAKGYSPYDILSFFFVRQIPQLKRDGSLGKTNAEQAFANDVRFRPATLDPEKKFSYAAFLDWYKQKTGTQFSIENIQNDNTAPVANSNVLTQRISADISQIRDSFILRTIADVLNEHNCVLVVYGRGHIVIQRPVLEDMLGKPVKQFNNL